jgi:hypothetical protein
MLFYSRYRGGSYCDTLLKKITSSWAFILLHYSVTALIMKSSSLKTFGSDGKIPVFLKAEEILAWVIAPCNHPTNFRTPLGFSCVLLLAVLVFTSRIGVKYISSSQ